MPNTHTTLTSLFSDIADSIRAKTGSSADIVADNFPTEIMNIPTGGTVAVPSSDVNFIDYDGTILYSYTKADFANLTALPANPTHAGLTAQGWNWSLSDAKIYVNTYGFLDIGQMYTTDDGKTRIYISLTSEDALSPTIWYYQSVANGVSVDWGDGSTAQSTSGTGSKHLQHTYSSIGDYVIKITVNSGECRLGNGTTTSVVIGGSVDTLCYTTAVTKIEIGSRVTRILAYALYRCSSLKSITIPNTLTYINASAFRQCSSICGVVLPISTTAVTYGTVIFYGCQGLRFIATTKEFSTSSSLFNSCYALNRVAIAEATTSIGSYAFYSDYSLTRLKFPSGITTIEANAFYRCYSVQVYDFTLCTAVPTLDDVNAFTDISSTCKIVVPDSLYSSWTTASNWSTYASNIIKESDWT